MSLRVPSGVTGPLSFPGIIQTSAAPPIEPECTQEFCAEPECPVDDEGLCTPASSTNEPNSVCFPAQCESTQATNDVRNFFVNGILTPEEDAEKLSRAFEDVVDGDVELLYNQSEGLLQDGCEALQNMAGMGTDESINAAIAIRAALEQGQKVRLISHSQGAAIVGDALERLERQYQEEGKSSQEIQAIFSNVEVFAMGGFVTERAFPEGVHAVLINRERDYIPQFAERFRDLEDARTSQEQDMGQAIGAAARTFGDFVSFNFQQMVEHTKGKIQEVRADGSLAGMSFGQAFSECVGSICTAVESDHLVMIEDEYTKKRLGQGYLEDFEARFAESIFA